MSASRKYALFVGRWQGFHEGHAWLIDQKLKKGVPVLIAVRDVARDESNPFDPVEIAKELRKAYEGQDVKVILIPDIESINFGRDVGYEVNEFVPPNDIATISATKIRHDSRSKD